MNGLILIAKAKEKGLLELCFFEYVLILNIELTFQQAPIAQW